MERLASSTWGLREVKSSSGLKDHHLDGVALQAFVLRGAGITVSSIELLHVGADCIGWRDFFVRVDLGDAVADRRVDLPARLPGIGGLERFSEHQWVSGGNGR